MQAAVLESRGRADFKLRDLPKPMPKPGEALLRVHAVSLNRVDLHVRASGVGITHELPLLQGVEAAGVVAEAPTGIELKAGQKAVVYSNAFCGRRRYCRAGDQPLCPRKTGEHLASLQSVEFMRGDGGCGSWGEPAARSAAFEPIADAAKPIATLDYRTSPQAALLYRAASRDWMPIQADPAVAREAGFEQPISHGLNNLELACRAILRTCARGRLRSLAARFVAPGLPGDTVHIELFDRHESTLGFRATAIDRGGRLLDRGNCALHG